MVRICGNSQAEIAKDIAEYEIEVEKNIIGPFQTVVEVSWLKKLLVNNIL